MDRNLYQKLLVSLKAGEGRICADGAEIAVRSCYDREEGCLDPRTEAAATLTREDFETRAGEIDPELLRNQDKLLGIIRRGIPCWNSCDISSAGGLWTEVPESEPDLSLWIRMDTEV